MRVSRIQLLTDDLGRSHCFDREVVGLVRAFGDEGDENLLEIVEPLLDPGT